MKASIATGLLALLLLGTAVPATAYDLTEMYPDGQSMDRARGFVGKGDMDSAVKQYMSAAEYGNKEAQKLVGLSYLDGSGVDQDFARALAWLELASSFGDLRTKSAYQDLYAKVGDDQREEAQKILKKLKKDYGDKAALKKRKKWVRREFRDMTGSGSRRPSPAARVQVSLSPGRYHTVTMRELQETLDSYVDDFEERMEAADS